MKGFIMRFIRQLAAIAFGMFTLPAAATYPAGTISSGGLTWLKPDASLRSWVNADTYCADSTVAGQPDWRLPMVSELTSLYSDKGTAFITGAGWPAGWIWASTPFSSGRYVARMSDGLTSWAPYAPGNDYSVTCVRNDAGLPAGTLTNGGLTWIRPDSTLRTWDNGNAYCSGLNIAGKTGWRLPTEEELVALYTEKGSSHIPMLEWPLGWIHASTPYSNGHKVVRMSDGIWSLAPPAEPHSTACVIPGTDFNAPQFYARDGSTPLTGALAGGGQDANNLRNINASGDISASTVNTNTLNAANITPTHTAAQNTACNAVTQGYFAKDSNGVLLSCQAGAWTRIDQHSAQLQSQVNALTAADSVMQTQLTSLTTTSATQTQLATLQTQLTTLQTQLNTLNTATATKAELTALQSQLNALQVQVNVLQANSPSQMYKRDGSLALTGPLAGGGQDANNLRNINASGTLQADTANLLKLSAVNITPELTVLENSTCNAASQGYFAKNSNRELLSCQGEIWSKQSAGGAGPYECFNTYMDHYLVSVCAHLPTGHLFVEHPYNSTYGIMPPNTNWPSNWPSDWASGATRPYCSAASTNTWNGSAKCVDPIAKRRCSYQLNLGWECTTLSNQ